MSVQRLVHIAASHAAASTETSKDGFHFETEYDFDRRALKIAAWKRARFGIHYQVGTIKGHEWLSRFIDDESKFKNALDKTFAFLKSHCLDHEKGELEPMRYIIEPETINA